MTKFTTVEQLESYLEDNCGGYYTVRGLDGYNATINYNDGDEIAKSLDLYDERGIEYNANANMLNGTSGLAVSDMMYCDELERIIAKARKYGTRVILIHGDTHEDGEDNGESVIIGATFCGEIEF